MGQNTQTRVALIVGTGSGISASLAKALHARGWKLALVSRDPKKFAGLAAETEALALAADASVPEQMRQVFAELDSRFPHLDLAVYNAGLRATGPIASLDPDDVQRALLTGAYGGFLMAREAAMRMESRGQGAIFFTGATASLKGYARSAAFAMGKFALRGLAQSAARELQPKGIHVAHFIIDGLVRDGARGRLEPEGTAPDSYLDPDAIAASYLSVLDQPRSAWTHEIDLRPWAESF